MSKQFTTNKIQEANKPTKTCSLSLVIRVASQNSVILSFQEMTNTNSSTRSLLRCPFLQKAFSDPPAALGFSPRHPHPHTPGHGPLRSPIPAPPTPGRHWNPVRLSHCAASSGRVARGYRQSPVCHQRCGAQGLEQRGRLGEYVWNKRVSGETETKSVASRVGIQTQGCEERRDLV